MSSPVLWGCGATFCAQTPHAVKNVLCSDLYSTNPHTRARAVHRYESLWDERLRIRYENLERENP